jgi:hypothetical protein
LRAGHCPEHHRRQQKPTHCNAPLEHLSSALIIAC